MSLINRLVALAVAVLVTAGCSPSAPTPTASASTPVQTAVVQPTATAKPVAAPLPLPEGGMSTNRKVITQCQNKTDEVTITIDDGISTKKKLDAILATLKKENVRAYFFMLGEFAKKHPKWMKKIADAGHVLGNHSYDHPNFTAIKKSSPKKHPDAWKVVVTDQIERGVQGNTQVKLLRPPYGNGAFDKDIRKLAKSLGYGMCYWTVDTVDWDKHLTKSPQDIINRVHYGQKHITGPIRKGGVILIHGTTKYGAAALKGIIKVVRIMKLKLQKLRG